MRDWSYLITSSALFNSSPLSSESVNFIHPWISLDSKFFMTWNLGLKIIFGTKQSLGPNNICNQKFWGTCNFSGSHIFGTYTLSCSTIFRYLNFPEPKLSEIRIFFVTTNVLEAKIFQDLKYSYLNGRGRSEFVFQCHNKNPK